MALLATDESAVYLMDESFIAFRSGRMNTEIIIGKFKPWLAQVEDEELFN